MWLSVFSLWGSLLTLVASQSCPDPSEHSASWVRLKPLGQCKDGESTCPYSISLPPLTVQLPKSFRELEKMARELQSLTRMVNQLKEDCRECKERQGMDWNKRTNNEEEDRERIQASRGTLNTKGRQQDIAKRQRPVQVTISTSAVKDPKIISSDEMEENPTAFGKQRNTKQGMNVNPPTTKPRAETNEGPKGSNSSQKNMTNRSRFEEVPSVTTTKKTTLQSPMDTLYESSFPGDLDSEQPTQHEKHKASKIEVGYNMNPSGTLTAKGKVKSIPEYQVDTIVTDDDDDDDDDTEDGYVETKQVKTPKSDTVLVERRLVTGGTDAPNNREPEPNMKQLTRKQQEEEGKKGHSRPSTADTIRGQKKLSSPITDKASASVNVSQINSQTLEIKSKYGFKPDTNADSEKDAGMNLNPVYNVDTISGVKNSRKPTLRRTNVTAHVKPKNPKIQKTNFQTLFKPRSDAEGNTGVMLNNSGLPISVITDDIVDVSLPNPQILDNNNQFEADTDSESDTGIAVNNSETVTGLKNSRSPISDSANSIAYVAPDGSKRQSSNSQSSLKYSKYEEHDTGMNSNPVKNIKTVSGQDVLQSPISGTDDGIVNVSPTTTQIVESRKQSRTHTDSETDAVMFSKPVNNDTVSGLKNSTLLISHRINATVDLNLINPKTQSSYSQTSFKSSTDAEHHMNSNPVNKLNNSRSPTPGITDGTVDVSPTNPQIMHSKNQVKAGSGSGSDARVGSHPVNNSETIRGQEMSRSDAIGDVGLTYHSKSKFKAGADSESYAVSDLYTVHNVATDSGSKNSGSSISDITDASEVNQTYTVTLDGTFTNQLQPGTDKERKPEIDSNPLIKVDTKKSYPYQNHSTDETSEIHISDSRLNVNDTNPRLYSNDHLPKRQLLPKSKLNMTQSRNGQIKSSNPGSIDSERQKTLRNNKTTALRKYAITSGRHLPTGLLPRRPEKQKDITNQPERTNPGMSPSKDPRRRKPYIWQRRPVNESKAFGSRDPKNTSGQGNYTTRIVKTRVYSETVSSHNNVLNSTAHIKSAKTAPAVEVLDMVNRQSESTSQTAVTEHEKLGGSSQQDLVLDIVNNIGRDSQPPVLEETKGNNRRTAETPFKSSSVQTNQEKHKKTLREGGTRIPDGMIPLTVARHDRNELNYPTTTTTSYTTKTEFKDKHSTMSQFTPPIITTPHFMDQDHTEKAKTTSRVKVSNKHVHHRLKNPGQEMESKKSHSDTGNKELQNARNGQESSESIVLRPNFSDSNQNGTAGSTGIIMDLVKSIAGSKVSTISTESTDENRARDSDSVKGNNGGHSVDTNNGKSYPVAVDIITGETLYKIPYGQTNSGDNKKPLTVNNVNERQGLEKQLLSNCHGDCDLSPTPWSERNSHESLNNDRDKSSQDCSDFIMRNPTSGIYNVTPTISGNRTFPVFCDMKSSGGGWTLIQHRFDGSISFNRTWNDYKNGFGNLKGEFWLGNEKIHWLTSTKAMVLRIEFEDLDGIKDYAQYDHFHVANESQYYRLMIEGYSGTAGDAMRYSKMFNHNGKNFTTPDRDNDQYTSGNCGAYYSSGWWFDACMAANLNGKYYETRYKGVRNGIFWGTWHNISSESYLTHDRQSFKTVRMMIRPRTGLLMD